MLSLPVRCRCGGRIDKAVLIGWDFAELGSRVEIATDDDARMEREARRMNKELVLSWLRRGVEDSGTDGSVEYAPKIMPPSCEADSELA